MSVSQCICTSWTPMHTYTYTLSLYIFYLPSVPFVTALEGVKPFFIIPAPPPPKVLILACARGVVTATSACVPGVTSENSSGIGRFRELPSGDGFAGSGAG
ncbi:hypothetical protein FRC08_018149 [Ceratobasidium sp. 394]|nr:hypothetical protein FRC08_018149 [Ceratobasidium sp. 394]